MDIWIKKNYKLTYGCFSPLFVCEVSLYYIHEEKNMLNKDEMKKIALKECIEMMGNENIEKNKERCCCTYGMNEQGLFSYVLGMDVKDIEFKLGGETPPDYRAVVLVNPKDGTVTRDYENSVLPN